MIVIIVYASKVIDEMDSLASINLLRYGEVQS